MTPQEKEEYERRIWAKAGFRFNNTFELPPPAALPESDAAPTEEVDTTPRPHDQRAADEEPYRGPPMNKVATASALSESDEWESPQELFDRLNKAFGQFTLDAAASHQNHKCATYLTKAHDAPGLHVGQHRVWLNFPYSRGNPERFTAWALAETLRSAPIFCCLGPATTAEGWWQKNVERADWVSWKIYESVHDDMRFTWRQFVDGIEVGVHFLAGRQHFIEASGKTGPARFSSAVVVYRRLR